MAKKSEREKWLEALETLEAVPVIGADLRAYVSATDAHFEENPERAQKAARDVRDKARRSRRGRGATPKKPEEKGIMRERMRRYRAKHGLSATLDHFTGVDESGHNYSPETVVSYTKGIPDPPRPDKKSG